MSAEHGRLHLGGIFLVLALTSFIPNTEAAKPITRQVNNTLVWNMASYAVLSTSSIVEDRFPFAGLPFLRKKVQIFDDNRNPFKYTYSSKHRNADSFFPFCKAIRDISFGRAVKFLTQFLFQRFCSCFAIPVVNR